MGTTFRFQYGNFLTMPVHIEALCFSLFLAVALFTCLAPCLPFVAALNFVFSFFRGLPSPFFALAGFSPSLFCLVLTHPRRVKVYAFLSVFNLTFPSLSKNSLFPPPFPLWPRYIVYLSRKPRLIAFFGDGPIGKSPLLDRVFRPPSLQPAPAPARSLKC